MISTTGFAIVAALAVFGGGGTVKLAGVQAGC